MVPRGIDILRIDRIGKNESPVETAQWALQALLLGLFSAVASRRFFLTSIAGDGQDSIIQRDFHILWLHPRDIQQQLESVAIFANVYRRTPLRGGTAGFSVVQVPEYPIDILLQLGDDPPRFVTSDGHGSVLQVAS